jgi:ketosteroid isomerase-like protein
MIDPAEVRPELDPQLVERTREYLAAVDSGDLDAMEAFYAPEFVNIRYDRAGQVVNIPRAVFMRMLRGWASAGAGGPVVAAERTEILATSHYGDCASVLMLRVKNGETVTYNFVWQQRASRWQVLREFTTHDKLPTPDN